MTYFLFVDESGHDRREAPYEVLAGVAVHDSNLWNLIVALREAEVRAFGGRYSGGFAELKAKKLLNRKTYRLAQQLPPIDPGERARLARECLDHGESANRQQITAIAQAKLAYVAEALEICSRHNARAFASIVHPDSPYPASRDHLRKDYAYLFERFYYFLEDVGPNERGVVVFDELDKSRSHILIGQMDQYFLNTTKGRIRSSRIIPEPFFVHSELTTGIQLADLVAYIISWGFRTGKMTQVAREELRDVCDLVASLRYRAVRDMLGRPDFSIWSFAYIADLRSNEEISTATAI